MNFEEIKKVVKTQLEPIKQKNPLFDYTLTLWDFSDVLSKTAILQVWCKIPLFIDNDPDEYVLENFMGQIKIPCSDIAETQFFCNVYINPLICQLIETIGEVYLYQDFEKYRSGVKKE